jgi:hypothetical protein
MRECGRKVGGVACGRNLEKGFILILQQIANSLLCHSPQCFVTRIRSHTTPFAIQGRVFHVYVRGLSTSIRLPHKLAMLTISLGIVTAGIRELTSPLAYSTHRSLKIVANYSNNCAREFATKF